MRAHGRNQSEAGLSELPAVRLGLRRRVNMDAQKIRPNDWHRILSGQEPVAFYLEIVLRVAVVYLILMLAMRLLGKRMSSQLSRTELAVVVSLAAAVGVPLLSP